MSLPSQGLFALWASRSASIKIETVLKACKLSILPTIKVYFTPESISAETNFHLADHKIFSKTFPVGSLQDLIGQEKSLSPHVRRKCYCYWSQFRSWRSQAGRKRPYWRQLCQSGIACSVKHSSCTLLQSNAQFLHLFSKMLFSFYRFSIILPRCWYAVFNRPSASFASNKVNRQCPVLPQFCSHFCTKSIWNIKKLFLCHMHRWSNHPQTSIASFSFPPISRYHLISLNPLLRVSD